MACGACRRGSGFPGMVLGAGVAVLLRIMSTGIVVTLMGLPFLKLVEGSRCSSSQRKLRVQHEGEAAWMRLRVPGGRAVRGDRRRRDEPRQRAIAVAAAANGIPLRALPLVLIVRGRGASWRCSLPALVWAGAGLLGLDRRRSRRPTPQYSRRYMPSSTARLVSVSMAC